MGSSESKVATVSTPKPDPQLRIKNQRLAELADPRSPTTGIDRTPIQTGAVSKAPAEPTASAVSTDPRSPTHGISRTPLKDSMSVTVSSFARRLGMLFMNESTVEEDPGLPRVTFTKRVDLPVEEVGSTEPLLTPHPSMDRCGNDVTTVADVYTPSQGYGSLVGSPFVLIGEETEVRAELSLEEAEDALVVEDSCPLKRELSLSLLTCHNGVHPSQICDAEEENDGHHHVPTLSEIAVGEQQNHVDHAYALPEVRVEPATPLSPPPMVEEIAVLETTAEPEVAVEETVPEMEIPVIETVAELEIPSIAATLVEETLAELEIPMIAAALVEEEPAPKSEAPVIETVPEVEASPEAEVFEESSSPPPQPELTGESEAIPEPPSTLKTSEVATLPLPADAVQPQPQAQAAAAPTGIRCPTFDTKSPSQVVFKPQWLGVGFGATGIKPRSMQGRGKGSSSSPLASKKSSENTNAKGLSVSMKQKHKGKTLGGEGRSPLQLLRETNSPRENASQMKLKISTPDRQRIGQLDRRALIQSMNKENQR